jgi:hypothetical protein
MAITNGTVVANGHSKTNGGNGANGARGTNGTNVNILDLPDKRSPTLALLHPTEEEKLAVWKRNGAEWRGALSLEAYLRRETHLGNQDFTKNGGITFWILVDTAAKNRVILSACETYKKKALVARNGKIEETVTHGIGSVFCPPECRKRGYAGVMMKMVGEALKTWQVAGEEQCAFSILYSDIGKVSLGDQVWFGQRLMPCRISMRHTVGNHSTLHTSQFHLHRSRAKL